MKDFVTAIIKEAGYLAKDHYHQGVKIDIKTNASDVVTKADYEVNDFLTDKIREKFPDHSIHSEERDEIINSKSEYTWVLDPIDGTRNFANHIPVWCVMVGLVKDDEPVLGAIYDAMNDELFFAEKNKGATLNNTPIEVSNYDKVDQCFIFFSEGCYIKGSPYCSEKFPEFVKFRNNIMGDDGHWIHNFGSMLGLCQMAAGRADAIAVNCGLYHDYVAPSVIAKEAGAAFSDCEGNPWKKGRFDIVSANPTLHAKLLELFK